MYFFFNVSGTVLGHFILCICITGTYGLILKGDIYSASCDPGIKVNNSSFTIASFAHSSVIECACNCKQKSECRSFDFRKDVLRGNCMLINSRSYSGCTANNETQHFTKVRQIKLAQYLYHIKLYIIVESYESNMLYR